MDINNGAIDDIIRNGYTADRNAIDALIELSERLSTVSDASSLLNILQETDNVESFHFACIQILKILQHIYDHIYESTQAQITGADWRMFRIALQSVLLDRIDWFGAMEGDTIDCRMTSVNNGNNSFTRIIALKALCPLISFVWLASERLLVINESHSEGRGDVVVYRGDEDTYSLFDLVNHLISNASTPSCILCTLHLLMAAGSSPAKVQKSVSTNATLSLVFTNTVDIIQRIYSLDPLTNAHYYKLLPLAMATFRNVFESNGGVVSLNKRPMAYFRLSDDKILIPDILSIFYKYYSETCDNSALLIIARLVIHCLSDTNHYEFEKFAFNIVLDIVDNKIGLCNTENVHIVCRILNRFLDYKLSAGQKPFWIDRINSIIEFQRSIISIASDEDYQRLQIAPATPGILSTMLKWWKKLAILSTKDFSWWHSDGAELVFSLRSEICSNIVLIALNHERLCVYDYEYSLSSPASDESTIVMNSFHDHNHKTLSSFVDAFWEISTISTTTRQDATSVYLLIDTVDQHASDLSSITSSVNLSSPGAEGFLLEWQTKERQLALLVSLSSKFVFNALTIHTEVIEGSDADATLKLLAINFRLFQLNDRVNSAMGTESSHILECQIVKYLKIFARWYTHQPPPECVHTYALNDLGYLTHESVVELLLSKFILNLNSWQDNPNVIRKSLGLFTKISTSLQVKTKTVIFDNLIGYKLEALSSTPKFRRNYYATLANAAISDLTRLDLLLSHFDDRIKDLLHNTSHVQVNEPTAATECLVELMNDIRGLFERTYGSGQNSIIVQSIHRYKANMLCGWLRSGVNHSDSVLSRFSRLIIQHYSSCNHHAVVNGLLKLFESIFYSKFEFSECITYMITIATTFIVDVTNASGILIGHKPDNVERDDYLQKFVIRISNVIRAVFSNDSIPSAGLSLSFVNYSGAERMKTLICDVFLNLSMTLIDFTGDSYPETYKSVFKTARALVKKNTASLIRPGVINISWYKIPHLMLTLIHSGLSSKRSDIISECHKMLLHLSQSTVGNPLQLHMGRNIPERFVRGDVSCPEVDEMEHLNFFVDEWTMILDALMIDSSRETLCHRLEAAAGIACCALPAESFAECFEKMARTITNLPVEDQNRQLIYLVDLLSKRGKSMIDLTLSSSSNGKNVSNHMN